jgi:hypothetical protein
VNNSEKIKSPKRPIEFQIKKRKIKSIKLDIPNPKIFPPKDASQDTYP